MESCLYSKILDFGTSAVLLILEGPKAVVSSECFLGGSDSSLVRIQLVEFVLVSAASLIPFILQ